MLENLFIGGLPVSILVIAIVALVKRLGLPKEWWPWFTGGVSALLGGLVLYVIPLYPEIKPVLEAVTVILSIFITASGTYQLSKNSKEK